MGKCQQCGRNIKIKKGEPKCPVCGENPYSCWNCHQEIDVKQEECPICGFYTCQECGSCGKYCNKESYIKALQNEAPFDYAEAATAVKICFSLFQGTARMNCPTRNVPVSYAHQKLRNFVLQIKDPRKRESDSKAFQEKVDKIFTKSMGETWTISEMKEDGTHGQEMREASFLSVCSGVAEVTKRITKEDKDKWYWCFKRIEKEPCPHAKFNDLIIRECRKCAIRTKEMQMEECPKCGGVMKVSRSHPTFCNLPKREFIIKKAVIHGEQTK